ncbi:hypothetical protein [Puia dinghuensis]|uniref:Transporter n=1 Tax=Puia dinghuensis TaxID=1792502 RepID=A0A8J2UFN4_9BACT|nr:hypothetical protein [Puia dinghuensis]GGB08922.1 hypothetical protein GCM10011511_35560 [Puia dinghuensis]
MMNCKNAALFAIPLLVLLSPAIAKAQTDEDAITMAKKNLCIGATYMNSSWDHYWEGTFKRNNQNLGTVSTQQVMLMGTYGITKKLNIVVGAPYIWTHSTAGTLHGQHGIQDLSAWVKWEALQQKVGKGVVKVFLLGGGSIPLTNYIADYLPLSIGLQSKTASGRLLIDYQLGNFFATASGTYTGRSDITIDRNSYYTASLHLTNKVFMPDMASWNVRTGYRSKYLIVEGVFSDMITLGGFDIRKNDMPFPSNKMNSTMAGADFKYELKKPKGLSIVGGAMYTLSGRNIGQSTSWDLGVFYIIDFAHKNSQAKSK